MLEICAAEGIAFLPWRPLGHDGLSADGQQALANATARLDATPRQVALAWVLGQAPVVCAIPGTGDLGHLEENVAAAGLTLSTDEGADLDHAAAP